MTSDWTGLVKDSLLRPRQAARQVLLAGLPPRVSVQIGTLAIVVGTMLQAVLFRPMPDAAVGAYAVLMSNPLLLGVLQVLFMLVTASLAVTVGRWFGGMGGYPGSIALLAWFQVCSTLLLLAQALLFLVFTPLASLLILYTMVWLFWALTAFVAELHGFERNWAVFGGVFVTLMVISIALGLLAAIAGIPMVETL
ncbi:MAG: YIP1 family protein [Pseudomonadota bacterium]